MYELRGDLLGACRAGFTDVVFCFRRLSRNPKKAKKQKSKRAKEQKSKRAKEQKSKRETTGG